MVLKASQKVLMHLSYPQTYEPNYCPEIKGLVQLVPLIWNFLKLHKIWAHLDNFYLNHFIEKNT